MGAIEGQVTDAAGQPLAGASVYIVAAPVATPDIALLTGADGGFRLSAPAAGTYRIGVAAPGYGNHEVEVAVAGGGAPPVRVRMAGG